MNDMKNLPEKQITTTKLDSKGLPIYNKGDSLFSEEELAKHKDVDGEMMGGDEVLLATFDELEKEQPELYRSVLEYIAHLDSQEQISMKEVAAIVYLYIAAANRTQTIDTE